MITVLHRGEGGGLAKLLQASFLFDKNRIFWGYAHMITLLYRGDGSLWTLKSDYVICARPLGAEKSRIQTKTFSQSLERLDSKTSDTSLYGNVDQSFLKAAFLPSACTWTQI